MTFQQIELLPKYATFFLQEARTTLQEGDEVKVRERPESFVELIVRLYRNSRQIHCMHRTLHYEISLTFNSCYSPHMLANEVARAFGFSIHTPDLVHQRFLLTAREVPLAPAHHQDLQKVANRTIRTGQ